MEQYRCSVCETQYSSLSNLRKHTKKFHPEDLPPPRYCRSHNENSFHCSKCEKSFNYKQNLQRHMKTHHNQENAASTSILKEEAIITVTTRNNKKCPLCSQCYNFESELLAHFEDVHEVKISCEQFTFLSFDAFSQWKSDMENETNSSFVKQRTKNSNNHTSIKYVCHRSGEYLPRGDGKRRLKTQGSKKINAYCPSNIRVTIGKDENIKAKYIKTHIGHEAQVGHLCLTKLERQNIAAKIASKISFDEILNQVRDSVTDNNLKRIHLLTKKDLFNIAASFNLSDASVRHPNDAISVDSWVTEMQRIGDCILFYKRQGSLMESHPMLKEQDFVVIIMTSAQSALLNKYGSNCICLDGTRGNNFELTTLLVLDNIREGFPCAFMVSNRSDKDVMSIFFSKIKTKTGILKPKTFMSDLADSYYNAWIEVMSVPIMRLFCTWHIDRAWRKNLIKIVSKEKQVIIYKQLRTLLEERDATAFRIMLKKFCTTSDPETSDFVKYFKDNYQKNYRCWAYCCRLNAAGINTNMHLERMHETLEYIYLKGKRDEKLDKAIAALMRFVRDKLINRLIVMNKEKISSKLKNIHTRHKNMQGLDLSLIVATENGWEVPSGDSNEIYFIQEINNSCVCQLICSDCSICIHRYCCTCMDSSIKFNMCKHIHLLAQFRKTSENVECGDGERTSKMSNDLHVDVSRNADESEVILSQPSKKRKKEMSMKERKTKNLMQYKKHLDSVDTEYQMEVLERTVASLSSTLAAVKKN